MLPNSAYTLEPIVVGQNYSQDAKPIYALLCTKSAGAGNVKMQARGNTAQSTGDITIPSVAFVVGVVYYIYLSVLTDDDSGNVKFVGFRYPAMPVVL